MNLKKIVVGVVLFFIVTLGGVVTYLYYNGSIIVEEILRERIIDDYNKNPKTKYFINLEKINASPHSYQ